MQGRSRRSSDTQSVVEVVDLANEYPSAAVGVLALVAPGSDVDESRSAAISQAEVAAAGPSVHRLGTDVDDYDVRPALHAAPEDFFSVAGSLPRTKVPHVDYAAP